MEQRKEVIIWETRKWEEVMDEIQEDRGRIPIDNGHLGKAEVDSLPLLCAMSRWNCREKCVIVEILAREKGPGRGDWIGGEHEQVDCTCSSDFRRGKCARAKRR